MTDNHITLDVLANYFAEVLDDAGQEAVELHIADCDRCADSAHWIHSLPRLDLETWTAQSHAQAALAPVLDSALAEADVLSPRPSIPERLELWRQRLASEALNLIKETSGVINEGLNVLMPPPGWGSGIGRLQTSYVTTFRTGEPSIPGAPGDTPTIHIKRIGIGIEIRVKPVVPDGEPGLVALVPTRTGEEAMVKLLEPASDDPQAHIARFAPDGDDFVIVLEPRPGDRKPQDG